MYLRMWMKIIKKNWLNIETYLENNEEEDNNEEEEEEEDYDKNDNK